MPQLKKGILISIEGIDGSGKSTLARTLYEKLAIDYPCTLTKEPGGTLFGQKLRTILQDPAAQRTPKAEFLLFAADRAQHFAEIVLPLLAQNHIIISDRMADSSLVYQGYGRGLEKDMITTINRWAMNNALPDLTVYAQISLEQARERIIKRQLATTSFEQEKDSFTQSLIDGFDEIFTNRNNVIIVDASQPADRVAHTTYERVLAWISTNR